MKSIQKEFRFLALLLVCASMLCMGGFWSWDDYTELQEGLEELQTRYMSEHRQLLQDKISNVIAFINYKKEQIKPRLQETVRQRTYEAIAIAENIVAENSGKLDDVALRIVIKDALRNIRYNDGRGYYFAINMNGVEELSAHKPQLEGKDLRSMLDSEGRPVIIDMLRIGKEVKEGFYSYTWTKPGSPESNHTKIAFVKYFEPFDWIIGTGAYLDDIIVDIQKEVIERVERIRFGNEERGYVFVGNYEGVSQSKPAKGRNMYDVQDLNGKYIVRELIRTAQEGSGFIEYVMPGIGGERPSLKLSYAAGVQDWQWYVGAGIYIDELEALIEARKKEFSDKTRRQFIILSSMSLSLLFFLYLVSTWLARGLGRNIDIFASFFKKAATESIDIDADSLRYKEFRDIADGANRMLIERNLVLQKVRDARDEWATTFNAIEDGILLLDDQGILLQANAAAINQIGKPIEEIQNQHFLSFCCENSPVIQTLEDGLVHTNEVTCPVSKLLYYSTSFPLLSDGQLKKVIIINRDITEQRSLEQQFQQAQKMESVGRLAGGVAHDFNNILSVINGYSQLCLMKMAPDDPQRKALQLIQDSGKKAARLTSQLLAFSRKQIVKQEILHLNQELEESRKMLGRLIGEDIKVRYIHGKDLWNVKMDRSQWEQVVMNLAVNARDAMPLGGTLTMETTNFKLDREYSEQRFNLEPGDYVLFTISDTGEGMSPEIREHIFEPFYTTKEKGQGTGLGLATVHGIIKQNGGEINVYSEPDKGTVFHIYLPRTENLESVESPQQNQAQPLQRGQETIMLVEDDEMVRKMVVEALTDLGYIVLEADTGNAALQTISRFHGTIDLLLSDVVMPGMSGPELVQQLKETKPELKVLFMSGYTEDTIVHHGVLKEGVNFIHKPVTPKKLAETVRTVLDQGMLTK